MGNVGGPLFLWKSFKDIDQRDSVIGAVVNDIINESLDKILERHIERISIVKAVHDVADILQDTIRLYFINSDQGWSQNQNFQSTWGQN